MSSVEYKQFSIIGENHKAKSWDTIQDFKAINRLDAVVKFGKYVELRLGEWQGYDELHLLAKTQDKWADVSVEIASISARLLVTGGK